MTVSGAVRCQKAVPRNRIFQGPCNDVRVVNETLVSILIERIRAASAPRGVDARRSDVFGLLEPGTEIIADLRGTQASVVLEQADDDDISLELIAWHVPFASRDELTPM